MLNSAVERHRAGRLAEAESLYKQILVLEPGNADSLHLLGVLASEAGHHERAASFISKAIQRKPKEPLY
ncbi:MAG: tetratricopeptide repeat protein, partial [bacterium]|nr:tetratricopeptide repeat protein [bacterium]